MNQSYFLKSRFLKFSTIFQRNERKNLIKFNQPNVFTKLLMVLVQNGQSCFKGICLFSNSIDLYDFLHDVRGPYAQRYSMIDLHSCLLQIRIKGVIMDLEAALLSFYLNSLVRFSWFFTRRKRWLLKSNMYYFCPNFSLV